MSDYADAKLSAFGMWEISPNLAFGAKLFRFVNWFATYMSQHYIPFKESFLMPRHRIKDLKLFADHLGQGQHEVPLYLKGLTLFSAFCINDLQIVLSTYNVWPPFFRQRV